ncbi:MAG: cytochrome c biogenesis protein CcdA [Acidobacteriota bacterium]
MNSDISFTLALVAGLASFLSPCVLPLVPVYVSLISGASLSELKNADKASQLRRVVFTNSIMFVLGFSIVFTSLGVLAGLLGTKLSSSLPIITKVAGILVIIFGLHMTGLVKIPFLYQDTRSQSSTGKGPLGSLLMGLAFAAGWSPCVGPILAGILVLAANKDTVLQATGLLSLYSVGLAIPFLLTAVAINPFLSFLNKFKRHLHKVEVTAGVLLIGIGLLIVSNNFTLLNRLIPDFSSYFNPEVGMNQSHTPSNNPTETKGLPVLMTAPELSFTDLTGSNVSLSSFKGKIVVLDFWATWCVPCREEVPTFNALKSKYSERGLEILAVAVDSDNEAIKKFIKDYSMQYPVAIGESAQGAQFDPFPGLPKTIIIDRAGRVRAKHLGLAKQEQFEREIEALLAEQ